MAKGGQAIVWDGNYKDREVAVKVFEGNAKGRQGFNTELRALRKIGRHPNIIMYVKDFKLPKPALLLEKINGTDLWTELHRRPRKRMKYDLVLRYAIDIADGLAHMHLNKVIHRDVKCSNCLVDAVNHKALIIDFGISAFRDDVNNQMMHPMKENGSERGCDRAHGREKPPATLVVNPMTTKGVQGTIYGMAPEMIRGRKWDERSDVYSFAILLWELNTSQTPYQNNCWKGRDDKLLLAISEQGARPSLTEFDKAERPPAMRDLITRCWHGDLEERPSMRRVVEDLEKLEENYIGRTKHARRKRERAARAARAAELEHKDRAKGAAERERASRAGNAWPSKRPAGSSRAARR